MKFIRGTITGKPAFEQSEIIQEINKAVKEFCIRYSFVPIILSDEALDDLVLCILCILHNATFELFDGAKGLSFLSVEKNQQAEDQSTLSLYAQTENFSFPIISSDL